MKKSFEFKINPRDCFSKRDEDALLRALELADGRYLISWMNIDERRETFMSNTDVFESLAEKSWIIIEQE